MFKNVRGIAQKFLIEISTHQSFDTYFKKIFHTGETSEIENGKKILNLYFNWEHNQTDFVDEANNLNDKFYKRALVDKRYDALIASLLLPVSGPIKTYTKVNFITWNYDLNLMMSLKNYFSPAVTIRKFLDDISTENPNVWNINDLFEVVNMNGFFYSKSLDALNKFGEIMQTQLLKDSIKMLFDDKENIDYSLLSFSWETIHNNNTPKRALNNIIRSKNIVSIGYTFPIYNRLQDLNYFNKKSISEKKVYIQDIDSERIVPMITDSFGIQNARFIQGIIDCSSFFVPSDIFNVELDTYGNYVII